jgi:nucleoside-specific outer membrane channel protein Tsx
MRRRTLACRTLLLLLAAEPLRAQASPPRQAPLPPTRSTTVSYLFGFNWNGPRRTRDIATIEHANRWRYGDNYSFIDLINLATHRTGGGGLAGDGHTSAYVEWQPRLSPARILTGRPARLGPVADILTAHEIDVGPGLLAHAHGLGIALRIPHVTSLKTNLLIRDDRDRRGTTWQVALGWHTRVPVGRWRVTLAGFADFLGREDDLPARIVADVQALLDVRAARSGHAGRLQLGVELSYRRTWGPVGATQRVPQLIASWTF